MQNLFCNVNWGSLTIYDHKTEDGRRKGLPFNMRGPGDGGKEAYDWSKIRISAQNVQSASGLYKNKTS